MKKAFTLVELLFVMVVLAIIAGVGTDILRSLFDNYAVTAQIHRLESVANNAADMIATRLEKRVPQTTAIETSTDTGAKNYEPLSPINGAVVDNGKLVFFRKAYELERNFISAKKGGVSAPRTSGFINELKTTTTGDNGNFTDEVEFTSIGAADLKLDEYELFFSNDSSLLYENKSNHFDRYYSGKKSFAYQCTQGKLEFQNGIFTLTRSGCPASTSTIIRPSMAALIHKFYLSKEIDKIYLDTNKNLYLETCNIKGADCKKSLLAPSVSTFRFSALGSDPNIASTIVFKLCLVENEGKDNEAEACQSRIVR